MCEVWKEITGYEGLYEVSNLGKVRSLRQNRILKVNLNQYGYARFGLVGKDGKRTWRLTHQLVAKMFIGECPKGMNINHKDEVRTNNRVDNLEYVTVQDNLAYGNRKENARNGIRMTCGRPVYGIAKDGTWTLYMTIRDAARELGTDFTNIQSVLYKKSKTACGLRWEYVPEEERRLLCA